MPGAGHLLDGSAWCWPWLLAAGCGTGLLLGMCGGGLAGRLLAAAWLGLAGCASALHAEKVATARARRPPAGRIRPRISCLPPRGRAVALRIDLEVPRPSDELWSLLADLPRFVLIDPFHTRLAVLGPKLQAGVQLGLEHQAFGVRFWRFGKLLSWREGCGYAFSDLSAKGKQRGFPHVFFVSLQAESGPAPRSRLTIVVRGKWTSAWIPVRLGCCWLKYVAAAHARLLAAAL